MDPLDGTREFGELREDWAVHVGLAIDGVPVLGAVALPATGEVLWGAGGSAGLESAKEKSRDLVRGDTEGGPRPVIAVSRSHTPDWVTSFAREMGGEMRPYGSVGYKVSRLFFGEADIYVHQKGLKEWDTCAPDAVARALGWSVTTLSGVEHVYNRKDPRNHEILVCRRAWRDRVLPVLARIPRTSGAPTT